MRVEGFTPEAVTGRDIVEEARRFLDVRFKHAGVTESGICCSGLVMVVGKRKGQVPADVSLPAHSPLRPSPRLFLTMRKWGAVVPEGEEQPGDVALMTHSGDIIQHCAIRSDVGLIHIFPAMSIRRVCEHALDDEWRRRIKLTLRYRGVYASGY